MPDATQATAMSDAGLRGPFCPVPTDRRARSHPWQSAEMAAGKPGKAEQRLVQRDTGRLVACSYCNVLNEQLTGSCQNVTAAHEQEALRSGKGYTAASHPCLGIQQHSLQHSW